jgi:signal transduction histidine kinase
LSVTYRVLKLLIADDSSRNLKLLRAGLESEGHQVVEAANGIEALEILERETLDAVISDILMPSMDGFRLCHEIRKSASHYRDIPLILYTATYDSPSDRALADTVGADGYILKPATAAVLIGAVQDALRKATVRPIATSVADDTYVLEHYNAALVKKLESRNTEVLESLTKLQAAHEQIVELNQQLETRVLQRTAALDAANRELEAFSFSVSHDLRAPLRRISGFAQLLGESASAQLDDDNREMLSHIIDGTTQMSKLIESLLEFARTSRAQMHFGEVDLAILLDKAISDLRSDSAGRTIQWRRGVLPKVHGDAILLHQVLTNLLSNALKYTRTRDPAVIEIGTRESGDNEVVVFVHDNGVGFDMRYAGKLFGVFQRMHRADEFEGTGIGLANAKRIVTRHGGAIWADAAVDSGATFYFSLPRS